MKTTADYKETERYIKEYGKLSNKDLKSLLKLLKSDPLKRKDTLNKIDAINTLLL